MYRMTKERVLKILVITFLGGSSLFTLNCGNYIDYDSPVVPNELPVPPVKEKLAALTGVISGVTDFVTYINYSSKNLEWTTDADDTCVDVDDDPFCENDQFLNPFVNEPNPAGSGGTYSIADDITGDNSYLYAVASTVDFPAGKRKVDSQIRFSFTNMGFPESGIFSYTDDSPVTVAVSTVGNANISMKGEFYVNGACDITANSTISGADLIDDTKQAANETTCSGLATSTEYLPMVIDHCFGASDTSVTTQGPCDAAANTIWSINGGYCAYDNQTPCEANDGVWVPGRTAGICMVYNDAQMLTEVDTAFTGCVATAGNKWVSGAGDAFERNSINGIYEGTYNVTFSKNGTNYAFKIKLDPMYFSFSILEMLTTQTDGSEKFVETENRAFYGTMFIDDQKYFFKDAYLKIRSGN